MAHRRALVLAAAILPLPVRAEEPHQGHTPASPTPTSHDWHGPLPTLEDGRRAAAATPAAGYRAASERMHREMDTLFAGDPDRDFVAALVPYGVGGVELARVALRQARDPDSERKALKQLVEENGGDKRSYRQHA